MLILFIFQAWDPGARRVCSTKLSASAPASTSPAARVTPVTQGGAGAVLEVEVWRPEIEGTAQVTAPAASAPPLATAATTSWTPRTGTRVSRWRVFRCCKTHKLSGAELKQTTEILTTGLIMLLVRSKNNSDGRASVQIAS